MSVSVKKSVLYGFLQWLLPLGLTFVATPIVIRALGVEEYGLFALVLGFISFSFTFSVGRAVTKYVAEYRAKNQPELINDTLSSTLLLSLILGIGGGLIVFLIARPLVVSVFDIKPELQEQAVVAFYIAAGSFLFPMLSQVFSSTIQAVHRFDVFSNISIIVVVIAVTGNILLALSGFSFNTLLVWNLISNAVGCLLFFLAGKKLLPEARWSLRVKNESFRLVTKFGAGVAVTQLLSNFLLLFERGLVTRLFETDGLAYYVVPMTLTWQIHALSSNLLMTIFPLASELAAKMETERLRSIYQRAVKYNFALVSFVVLSLSVCGHEFLRLWLNQDFADKSDVILTYQAITYGVIATNIMTWQVIEGLGFPNRNAYLNVTIVVVCILMMLFLSQFFGLEGIAFGRLLGGVPMLIYMFLVEKWVFGETFWSFWARVGLSLALAISGAIAVEYLFINYLVQGWLGLFAAVLAGAAVYGGSLFALKFLSEDERRNLQGIFFKAFPRFSPGG